MNSILVRMGTVLLSCVLFASVADPVGAAGGNPNRRRPGAQMERLAAETQDREAEAEAAARQTIDSLHRDQPDPARMAQNIEALVRARAEIDLRSHLRRWVAMGASELARQEAARPYMPGARHKEIDTYCAAVLEIAKLEEVPGWQRYRVEGVAEVVVDGAYGRWIGVRKPAFAALYEIAPDWSGLRLIELAVDGITVPLQ